MRKNPPVYISWRHHPPGRRHRDNRRHLSYNQHNIPQCHCSHCSSCFHLPCLRHIHSIRTYAARRGVKHVVRTASTIGPRARVAMLEGWGILTNSARTAVFYRLVSWATFTHEIINITIFSLKKKAESSLLQIAQLS